jgi:serine/threonine protein kinase
MPIEVNCPQCTEALQVAESARGKRIRCPKCKHVFSADSCFPPATKTSADARTGRTGQEDRPTKADQTRPLEPKRPPADDTTVDMGATREPVAPRQTRVLRKGQQTAEMPTSLGGYLLLEELGRGGMGTVYLARQLSLDRLVALKTMNPERAGDPTFLARFTREAYAAAQLVHHNVVQIYDIGVDNDRHFFSMEYVKGESLRAVVQRQGKLDPEVAVGYALQAARGLKVGHDLGMIHRDVKPENLLLSEHGIVKVADLGLVKIPHLEEPLPDGEDADAPAAGPLTGHVTLVGMAIGTPPYMAPEQASTDQIDARVDIYSLGCTLYALVTGKPPFEGKTAIEVISKHQSEPLVPPEAIVKRVPRALSVILVKMLAKKPADRYADMAAVIAELEKFLGVQKAGAFTPSEEHATLLEQSVKDYNQAPGSRPRRTLALGFVGGCALAFVACLLMGWHGIAAAALGLSLLTPLAYFLIHGWFEKSTLLLKCREWLVGSSWSELACDLAGLVLFLLILYLLGLLGVWLGMALLGIGLAGAFYLRLDRPLAGQRRPAIDQAEKLLRNLRLKGCAEEDVRQFVCKYSGRDWEEFYEALFGYEAKRQARDWLRGEAAGPRNKFAPWRDAVIDRLDALRQARQEARERKLLQAVEAKALQAQGLAAAAAQEKAAQVADAMVHQAAEIKKEAARAPAADRAPRAALRQLVETAQQPESVQASDLPRRSPLEPLANALSAVLGPGLRFLAGAILLVGFILWLQQNHYLEDTRLLSELSDAFANANADKLDHPGNALDVPLVPAAIRGLFHGLQPGIAGLILLIFAFVRGWKALAAWPAAVLILVGPGLGVPAVGPLSAGLVSLLAGLALAILAVLVGLGMGKKKAQHYY